ncbi:MAG: iron ABC transporter permease [Acidimicrobiaceae bacterium]|nr:iron ABC transporter permease [Acidimicrobiaceae bacterium]MXZ67142.1 iron ABC transporter permease [Acidimicrobiaceae bacterium]MYF35048.1 iron ABC transporter permease [Acidimicrobiaceae bacterium]MYG78048.1 iron ABC transporter permease [Acidimicrobiaceae bacterium]MYI15377.1 iron ABC transporter permease [Acidimicrobiaceae bacterium]
MRRLARAVILVLPALAVGGFMALFFVWPIGGVIARGLGGSGPAAVLGDVLGSESHRSVIWFTVWQAAVSTALTVAVALPAAGAMARLQFRGQRIVRALSTVPFVLPTVVVAAAFEGLFDRFNLSGGGALTLRHTVWAILLAHVFFNYAVVLRTVGAHWSALDARVEDQARVLGASRLKVFRRVVLPRLAPSIAAASAIVFLFSFTSFGVVLVLGGPTRATIETEIYRYAVTRIDLETAAALAVVQLVAVVALVVVSNALERRRAVAEPAASFANAPRRRGLGLVVNLALMAAILGLPIAVLVERSLAAGRGGGYTLRNYNALADRVNLLPDTALAALRNSLTFAVPATSLALLVGGAATLVVIRSGRRGGRGLGRFFDVGLTLPLGTSAVTVGLGFLLVLNRGPIDIRTSVIIVPIAHAVVGIPFVVRTLVPMLRTVNPRTREAAAVLGASPRRVQREVDLRVAARGLAVGAGFAFAVSLGEFGATSFIPRRPETLTAPLALFRLLGTPGETLRGQAMALAVALMALTAVAVFVMDLWGDSRRGGF